MSRKFRILLIVAEQTPSVSASVRRLFAAIMWRDNSNNNDSGNNNAGNKS